MTLHDRATTPRPAAPGRSPALPLRAMGFLAHLDDGGHTRCRRWCCRQPARSVISPGARRGPVVAEGLPERAEGDLGELAAALSLPGGGAVGGVGRRA